MRKFLALSLISTIALGAMACDDDEDSNNKNNINQNNTTPDMDVTPDMEQEPDQDETPDQAPDMEADTLYNRLGKRDNIKVVITSFVGRVLADDKINAYFLNNTLDADKLINCLSDQVGNLTGGPEQYPNANCRDMKSAHAGLNISTADYNDLAGHLVAELTARGVAQADIDTIAGALTAPAFVADIVEAPDNDETLYHRLGRKPGIGAALQGFAGRVLADPTLKDFFATGKLTDGKPDRLFLCLTSQVCDVASGPCEYGKESQLGANTCRDMKSSHAGMTDTNGNPVTIAEFNALVGHLVAELTDLGVAQEDINAVGAALGPTCRDIVANNGEGCP